MKGIVVVIVNPAGHVVATAADFGGVDAAGFSVESEQRRRAQHRAQIAFAKGHLNHWMAEKLTSGDVLDLWRLAERAGYTMSDMPVHDGSLPA